MATSAALHPRVTSPKSIRPARRAPFREGRTRTLKSLPSLWMTAPGSASRTGSRRRTARSRAPSTRPLPRSRWSRWSRIVAGADSILHGKSRSSAGWSKPASAASSPARRTPRSSSTAGDRGRSSASGTPRSQVTAQATCGAPSKATRATGAEAAPPAGATTRGTRPRNPAASRWRRHDATRSNTGCREGRPSFRTMSPPEPEPETRKFRSTSPGRGRTSPLTAKTSRAMAAAWRRRLFKAGPRLRNR